MAYIHYRKFATGGFVVSPPNMVYVTTLPCKTFFTLILCTVAKSPVVYTSAVIIANCCRMIFQRVVPDEYYLYFQVTGTRLRPRVIVVLIRECF